MLVVPPKPRGHALLPPDDDHERSAPAPKPAGQLRADVDVDVTFGPASCSVAGVGPVSASGVAPAAFAVTASARGQYAAKGHVPLIIGVCVRLCE